MPDNVVPDDITSDLSTWDVRVGSVVGRWDRAALKISPHEASPNRFDTGSKLCLEKDGKRRLIEVLVGRRQGKHWICEIGLPTLEAAEALIGATLWIHRSMRPPLPEGEFYLDEVLGLRVQTQSGEQLGEVLEILETPAHNIYVTPRAMIPAVPEWILETDWAGRVLVVRDEAVDSGQ